MPIKRPAFGGHLSTQQTNIRNLEESKRRKLTDSKRSESQEKTKVTAQEKKGDLQIVKEVCSVNSNKKEQKGKATSGLQNNLCSGKKKVVTRKNGGLDMANRRPRIKNEISKKTKTRVQNPVSKKRKAPNSRTPVKPKKLNSAEGSKGNVPKKILCKRIVGGAKKKQQIVKSLKTDHEKNEVVIIEPSFPHPRYSVSDASTSASLISTALKPTASTSATSASASSTSASAASTASEYAASISTIIANCPNLVNTRVVTIKEEKNDVSFYKENLRAWCDEEVVAEITAVDIYVVKNVIDLFNQECTIPFIARYRGEKVGNLQGNKLREIQESYDNIKTVRKKVDSVLKTLEKQNKLNEATALALLNAKTLSDVDHLLIPFKSGTARTLAERARKLGLEEWALKLMKGTVSISQLDFRNLVKNNVKDLSTSSKVCDGIQHIIADVIAKDRELLDYIRQISKVKTIRISSKKSAVAEKKDRRAYVETGKIRDHKFELYYQFDTSLDNIKPHQVMAINRGENLKKLIVRVNIPSELIHKTHQMCWNKFFSGKALDYESEKFLKKCIDDAYVRLLEPHLVRNIRSELTKKAQKECVDAFCSNLKNLLLTPPIRGKNVLGVDPGFKEGCKLAVVSSVGDLLDTDIIYPHLVNNTNDIGKVKRLITTHMVSAIAIGNGIGCREAEKWMSNLIKNNVFSPIEVKYCIISEQGVSIYSVSKEAEMEFPYLHPIFRSAVAIARRLQDPLSEYVKLDPKNLGVGMYQHDIPDPLLKAALNETIIECVSFVGVDLNICSEVLLRNVAGLSAKKAKSIIEWREKNGPFINRQQLLDVKGLGRKSFEQCAGFVKIFSETSRCSRSSYKNLADEAIQSQSSKVAPTENPLDMTIIHPESYNVAVGFLCKLNCKLDEIGKPSLSDKIRSYMESSDVSIMAYNFGINVQGMQLIIDALIKPVKFDIRSEFDKPLFRSSATSIEDLKLNDTLTGQVTNVTRFGAFVDIGVGVSSLLHKSQIRNQVVKLGDNITVKVIALDLCKMRINLTLAHQEQ